MCQNCWTIKPALNVQTEAEMKAILTEVNQKTIIKFKDSTTIKCRIRYARSIFWSGAKENKLKPVNLFNMKARTVKIGHSEFLK